MKTIEWLKQNTELDVLSSVRLKDLIERYKDDCKKQNYVPVGPKTFSRDIRGEYEHLISNGSMVFKNRDGTIICGLTLKPKS